MTLRVTAAVAALLILTPQLCLAEGPTTMPAPLGDQLAAAGPVHVVGFGDSITGVYYHTGGRRAWPEMLGLALQRLYPQTQITVTNAGQSGDNTAGALGRLDRDVLAHKPDLAVAKFGMNDVVGVPPDAYEANLREIVARCRAAKAAVVLCTPNAIVADGSRPPDKLRDYCDIVQRLGRELQVPVADCQVAFEAVRSHDPIAFLKLMSDAIHPNMSGHKLIAEEVAATVSGRRASLADVMPLTPGLPHVRERLDRREPLRVLAMPPYDELVGPALRALWPGAQLTIERWETAGQSLAQLEAAAKARGWMALRSQPALPRPDLVLFAIPPTATAPDTASFWRQYTWILNWSLSFGRAEWDAAAILPGVAHHPLPGSATPAAALALEVVRAQDLPYLERAPDDDTPLATLFSRWLQTQLGR